MWNLETYLFTAYKTNGCDVRKKWSAVNACNEMEADFKIRTWLATEPEWKGWELAGGSIEINDEKWANYRDYPGYECGEFFKENRVGLMFYF